eukprot:1318766-Amorphochlora_amoeboformis.AAC.1
MAYAIARFLVRLVPSIKYVHTMHHFDTLEGRGGRKEGMRFARFSTCVSNIIRESPDISESPGSHLETIERSRSFPDNDGLQEGENCGSLYPHVLTHTTQNAADDFLEDFEGGDDDSVSGDEKAPENKNSSPNGSASSSNTGEDPSAISRRRLNEIVQMGMSGGSEDAPPGFPGDAPPGFRDAPPDFPDQKSEKDKPHGNESSTDRPGQPPPGFGGSRKRERDEQSSSTKPTNVKRRQAKTPKVTVREVSERDWARVDSILDLAFSRVKPQDASSR